jgi:tetratricopeptide (TPR) repeat protein
MAGTTRKQQIEDLLADDPNDPFLRYGLAMEYVSEGNDEAAVKCFQELIAVAPDYVPGYLQIGQALLRLRRLTEAREHWSRGIGVARRQGDGHAAEEMEGFLTSLE